MKKIVIIDNSKKHINKWTENSNNKSEEIFINLESFFPHLKKEQRNAKKYRKFKTNKGEIKKLK